MAEGLSAAEVGKEIAEHHEHLAAHAAGRREHLLGIAEAVVLSVVAVLAAWSGYSAAKWGTESSLSLAHASASRTQASLATIEATETRTLDSVNFNAVATAYASGDQKIYRLSLRRLRPGYRAPFLAWLATHPLKNPNAPRDPSLMPQYVVPQEAQAARLNAQADASFGDGEHAAGIADRYVRITVFLASVLFIVGIGRHFPRTARYGLITLGAGLLILSVIQLGQLPGPPG